MLELVITDVESAMMSDLEQRATLNGRTPQDEAKAILAAALATKSQEPRDDWERDILGAARPWGVSFSNEAVSSEGLYE